MSSDQISNFAQITEPQLDGILSSQQEVPSCLSQACLLLALFRSLTTGGKCSPTHTDPAHLSSPPSAFPTSLTCPIPPVPSHTQSYQSEQICPSGVSLKHTSFWDSTYCVRLIIQSLLQYLHVSYMTYNLWEQSCVLFIIFMP